ncbi:MAG: hypothetical protein ACE5MG_09520 [Candidatus Methylomirabilales bacterium]
MGKDFDYQADAVRSTLIGMTQMAGAELTIAFVENRVVGFLLLSEPHPQSSWSRAALKDLFEVAAFRECPSPLSFPHYGGEMAFFALDIWAIYH